MMFINLSQKQAGFTLVMSMILLIILTMLGLTSIQSTRTEIAMAGNMRESDMAFQIAEMGLSSAEIYIEDAASKLDFNTDTPGLFAITDDDPDYFLNTTWDASQTADAAVLPHALSKPKFVIKYLGDRSQNEVAAVNVGGYGTAQPGITVSNFRATAMGGGQTDSATRMIQSYYGKEF